MLDSMQKNPRPTRAECTDVSNAVFDGADCVMLSGESAKGKYPVQSVATMKRIVDEAAKYLNGEHVQLLPGNSRLSEQGVSRRSFQPVPADHRERIALSVSDMVTGVGATSIIVLCETGNMAKSFSKFRPAAPIVAFVKNAKQARLLQIYYGVVPIVCKFDDVPHEKMMSVAMAHANSLGLCKKGDIAIVVQSHRDGDVAAGFDINVSGIV